MCSSMVQCVPAWCSALQCAEVCCSVLQCVLQQRPAPSSTVLYVNSTGAPAGISKSAPSCAQICSHELCPSTRTFPTLAPYEHRNSNPRTCPLPPLPPPPVPGDWWKFSKVSQIVNGYKHSSGEWTFEKLMSVRREKESECVDMCVGGGWERESVCVCASVCVCLSVFVGL